MLIMFIIMKYISLFKGNLNREKGKPKRYNINMYMVPILNPSR